MCQSWHTFGNDDALGKFGTIVAQPHRCVVHMIGHLAWHVMLHFYNAVVAWVFFALFLMCTIYACHVIPKLLQLMKPTLDQHAFVD